MQVACPMVFGFLPCFDMDSKVCILLKTGYCCLYYFEMDTAGMDAGLKINTGTPEALKSILAGLLEQSQTKQRCPGANTLGHFCQLGRSANP